ncbi:MAG: Peptidoglycan amidohydrolase [Lactococcus sp.]|jgi:flagellum-specific peptidoglycan hydrolase FlgJ
MNKKKLILSVIIAISTCLLGKKVEAASAVNDYIIKNNVKPAGETLSLGRIYNQNPNINGGINMDYTDGKPKLVIIHEVGVDGGSINGSIDYMVRTQDSAFVHSFVDGGQLITIADKAKKSWGSGGWGNQYGIQIEQMRVTTKEAFYKQISTLAKWTADQLIKYNMGAPKLMSSPSSPQKNNLSIKPDGNLASHKMIAYKFNQTTDHVDPDAYWARFGYDMGQFRELVAKFYSEKLKNIGNLDALAITGEGNNLKVRGWHYNTNQYEYLFVMDAETGKEIKRQQVTTPEIRNDVKSVYNFKDAEKSGFNITTPVPKGRKIYIMSRKTNDPKGNTAGGASDMVFKSKTLTTYSDKADLNTLSLQGNTLSLRGWYWPGQNYTYQYIFMMDTQTGKEISRLKSNFIDRPDVKNALNNLIHAERSGFSGQVSVPIDKNISVMIRRTNDPTGNTKGGYSDYRFNNRSVSTVKIKSDLNNLSLGSDTTVATRGWFWPKSKYSYQYVFIMDKKTNRELSRAATKIINRPDVKNYIGNFDGTDLTGFDATVQMPKNIEAYVMVRRTNDAAGNTNGGYEDAKFTNRAISNKQPDLSKVTEKVKIDWFNAIYPEAQKLAKANDLFPSIMMSQTIAESDWGQSDLATKANNFFGIKADASWKGAIYTKVTNEVVNEKTIQVTANFRKYSSQAESLKDYVTKIKTTLNDGKTDYRYRAVWRSNARTYQNAAQALKDGGYATDRDYPTNLIKRIVNYRLDTLD